MTLSTSDDALIDRVPVDRRARHGLPSADERDDRERTAELAAAVLGQLPGAAVRVSPLGAAWSSDVDVHVPSSVDPTILTAAGWIAVGPLLRHVGIHADRWAVVDDDRVVGAVDLIASPAPDGVAAVLRRAERRREVRLREVLELRVLHRGGASLPEAHLALSAAATLESALGGNELGRWLPPGSVWTSDDPVPVPRAVTMIEPLRTRAGRVLRRLRPRLVVGFSGVDGSGKSSLTTAVADDLRRAGVPVSLVWARPGMRLGLIGSVGQRIRRRRYGDTPGVRSVAAGAADVPVRAGFAGWLWATLVAAAFVVDVRRRHASSEGVVLFDRHLADAYVTLEFVYAGVRLHEARSLVRWALPRAAASYYVRVPAEVAVARKPGDSFGEHAVQRQLERYVDDTAGISGLVELDGTRPTRELAIEVLRHLAQMAAR